MVSSIAISLRLESNLVIFYFIIRVLYVLGSFHPNHALSSHYYQTAQVYSWELPSKPCLVFSLLSNCTSLLLGASIQTTPCLLAIIKLHKFTPGRFHPSHALSSRYYQTAQVYSWELPSKPCLIFSLLSNCTSLLLGTSIQTMPCLLAIIKLHKFTPGSFHPNHALSSRYYQTVQVYSWELPSKPCLVFSLLSNCTSLLLGASIQTMPYLLAIIKLYKFTPGSFHPNHALSSHYYQTAQVYSWELPSKPRLVFSLLSNCTSLLLGASIQTTPCLLTIIKLHKFTPGNFHPNHALSSRYYQTAQVYSWELPSKPRLVFSLSSNCTSLLLGASIQTTPCLLAIIKLYKFTPGSFHPNHALSSHYYQTAQVYSWELPSKPRLIFSLLSNCTSLLLGTSIQTMPCLLTIIKLYKFTPGSFHPNHALSSHYYQTVQVYSWELPSKPHLVFSLLLNCTSLLLGASIQTTPCLLAIIKLYKFTPGSFHPNHALSSHYYQTVQVYSWELPSKPRIVFSLLSNCTSLLLGASIQTTPCLLTIIKLYKFTPGNFHPNHALSSRYYQTAQVYSWELPSKPCLVFSLLSNCTSLLLGTSIQTTPCLLTIIKLHKFTPGSFHPNHTLSSHYYQTVQVYSWELPSKPRLVFSLLSNCTSLLLGASIQTTPCLLAIIKLYKFTPGSFHPNHALSSRYYQTAQVYSWELPSKPRLVFSLLSNCTSLLLGASIQTTPCLLAIIKLHKFTPGSFHPNHALSSPYHQTAQVYSRELPSKPRLVFSLLSNCTSLLLGASIQTMPYLLAIIKLHKFTPGSFHPNHALSSHYYQTAQVYSWELPSKPCLVFLLLSNCTSLLLEASIQTMPYLLTIIKLHKFTPGNFHPNHALSSHYYQTAQVYSWELPSKPRLVFSLLSNCTSLLLGASIQTTPCLLAIIKLHKFTPGSFHPNHALSSRYHQTAQVYSWELPSKPRLVFSLLSNCTSLLLGASIQTTPCLLAIIKLHKFTPGSFHPNHALSSRYYQTAQVYSWELPSKPRLVFSLLSNCTSLLLGTSIQTMPYLLTIIKLHKFTPGSFHPNHALSSHYYQTAQVYSWELPSKPCLVFSLLSNCTSLLLGTSIQTTPCLLTIIKLHKFTPGSFHPNHALSSRYYQTAQVYSWELPSKPRLVFSLSSNCTSLLLGASIQTTPCLLAIIKLHKFTPGSFHPNHALSSRYYQTAQVYSWELPSKPRLVFSLLSNCTSLLLGASIQTTPCLLTIIKLHKFTPGSFHPNHALSSHYYQTAQVYSWELPSKPCLVFSLLSNCTSLLLGTSIQTMPCLLTIIKLYKFTPGSFHPNHALSSHYYQTAQLCLLNKKRMTCFFALMPNIICIFSFCVLLY